MCEPKGIIAIVLMQLCLAVFAVLKGSGSQNPIVMVDTASLQLKLSAV